MKCLFGILFAIMPVLAYADATPFNVAMANVRANCAGISDGMSHLKTMAGINTAVSAVGTVAGGVALGTGIAKSQLDKDIAEVEALIAQYRGKPSYPNNPEFAPVDWDAAAAQLELRFQSWDDVDAANSGNPAISALTEQRDQMTEKSITLGNVRTGTMAASTATNIAGAVIAGTNKIDDDLSVKIGACMGAVAALSDARNQARVDGSASPEQLTAADNIISKCGAYDAVDMEKINRRATGGMVASSIGAASGLTGTITSGVANSDNVRNGDADKEQKLNTASNVLAGVTTAASATATIFNATQIAAIKKMSTIADECEGALK